MASDVNLLVTAECLREAHHLEDASGLLNLKITDHDFVALLVLTPDLVPLVGVQIPRNDHADTAVRVSTELAGCLGILALRTWLFQGIELHIGIRWIPPARW